MKTQSTIILLCLSISSIARSDEPSIAPWDGARSELIKQFAEAENARDIASNPVVFQERLGTVVSFMIPSSPKQAAQTYFDGWTLINQAREGKGWSGYETINGWSGSIDLTDSVLRRADFGLNGAKFYCELLRLDTKGEIPHSGWASKFLCLNALNNIINLSGGKQDLEQSLPALFKEIGEAFEDDSEQYSDILTISYITMLQRFSSDQLTRGIAIADEVAQSESNASRHALNFAMAGRFVAETNSQDRVSKYDQSQIPELASWRAHALKQLLDDSKRGSFLIPIAHRYARQPFHHNDAALSIQGGRIVADALKNNHRFNGFSFIQILQDFNLHSDHPEWTKVAKSLQDHWWQWRQHHQFASDGAPNYWMTSSMTMAAMEIFLQLDGPSAYARFEQEFGSQLHKPIFAQIPLILIKHGHFDDALTALKQHARHFKEMYEQQNSVLYTVYDSKGFDDQIAKFLLSIEEPHEAKVARELLSVLPDTAQLSVEKQKLRKR